MLKDYYLFYFLRNNYLRVYYYEKMNQINHSDFARQNPDSGSGGGMENRQDPGRGKDQEIHQDKEGV